MTMKSLVEKFDFAKRKKIAVRRCPICGAKRSSVIARRDRYGIEVEVRFCLFCSMMWLSPVLLQQEYADFYENWYRKLAGAYRQKPLDVEAVFDNQVMYGRQVAAFVSEFVNFNGHRPKILDIGGSTGFVSHALGQIIGEADITVVDPCESELARAASLGAATKHAMVEDYEIKDGEWDVILLCRTIDHLVNPMAILSSISRGLVSDGVAYVDYVDSWMVMESEGFHNTFHLDHPVAFTRESFTAALMRSAMIPLVYQTPEMSSTVGAILKHDETMQKTDLGFDAFDRIRHYQAVERKSWVTHA